MSIFANTGLGDLAQNAIGAVRDIFVARETADAAARNEATAQRASEALQSYQIANSRLIVLGLLGLAGIYFIARRME